MFVSGGAPQLLLSVGLREELQAYRVPIWVAADSPALFALLLLVCPGFWRPVVKHENPIMLLNTCVSRDSYVLRVLTAPWFAWCKDT